MPSPLAEAHCEAQARLRLSTSEMVGRAWDALPDHEESSVTLFCDTVVPVVEAAQRQSVRMLDGFCARESDRSALGLDPKDLVGAAARKETSPSEVYRRPFVELWSLLKEGRLWEDANHAARARLLTAVETDILRAQMLAAARVVELDPGTDSMIRVLRGTCSKCQEAAAGGSTVEVAIHPGCQCSVVPAVKLPKVHDIARARAAGKTWDQVSQQFGITSRRQINRMRQSLLDEGYDSYGKRIRGEKSFSEKVSEGMARAKAKKQAEAERESGRQIGRRIREDIEDDRVARQQRLAEEALDAESLPAAERYLAEKAPGIRVLVPSKSPTVSVPVPAKGGSEIGWMARKHLEDYYRLPKWMREAIDDNSTGTKGARVRIGMKVSDSIPELKGVRPRGWGEGSTWDDARGLYDPNTGIAYAMEEGRSGSVSTILHEIGHMIDDAVIRRYVSRDVTEVTLRDQLRAFHTEFYDRLIPYLQQGGKGGEAGMQELFAESHAQFWKWSKERFIRVYSEEYYDFMEDVLQRYGGYRQ